MKLDRRSLFDTTTFTQGPKAKGKGVTALPLTDWIRGTERLVEPHEHFLSWGVEQDKPILKVTSANGRQEFRVNMMSEIRDLEVSCTNLGPLQHFYVLSTTARPRISKHRRSSYILECIVCHGIALLDPFNQVRIFFMVLPPAPDKGKT